jgi:arylsulfatase
MYGIFARTLTFLPAVLLIGSASTVFAQAPLDRTVLPIHEPKPPIYTELDARKVKPPPRFEVTAPAGAPNILIILLDDIGFGSSSAFGGPIHMPTVERLASQGLRYNRFHTTALCAPTRVALLSGHNHHMNNMGSITETATAFPGYTGVTPRTLAPISNILRLNGYSTAQFGKNHETAAWEISPSGPTDRWPTRKGFDKFYGFYGGETNQWAPLIYDGMVPVELPNDPNYNFMTDMTDKAVEWVNFQQALTPNKPFFMYFAPGATHAPHHVPKQWIDKYKGKFDQGWDRLREETLARQIKLGVVPVGTKLAPKPAGIKDWDTLPADEKRLFARQMETFAGFAEYADTEIGRLIDSLRDIGQLDNTLIFYIVGDNGASAEGGPDGVFNEYSSLNGVPESVQDMLKQYDDWGGPNTYPHFAIGWAIAGSTPFSWAKQVASDFGGTRNGMVVHWPKRFSGQGAIRFSLFPCHRHRADHSGGNRVAAAEARRWSGASARPGDEPRLHV